MKKKKYMNPEIKVEYISLENGIAQGSGDINPGDQSGTVRIYEWDVLGNDDDLIISAPENSSWQ